MTLRELFISLTDNSIIERSDAIILLEGDGYYRVQKSIDLYYANWGDKIVFSGNVTNEAYGSYPFEWIAPLFKDAGISEKDIIHENKSTNTLEQAVEVIEMARKFDWKKIILVASHYHQYRAFLTFLKQVLKEMPELIIFNAPVSNLPWFNDCVWGKRIDLLKDEFKKIELYGQENDLATFEEALNYYKWRETQLLG